MASPSLSLGDLLKGYSVIDVSLYRICYINKATNHGNWRVCDKLGHYTHQGDPVLASPMPFPSFRPHPFLKLKLQLSSCTHHSILFFLWCMRNMQVRHLFPLTLFEACSELEFLFVVSLLPLSLLDPGAVLSTTTSIASSTTLVSVAANIGGSSVFGGFAELVFRDAQNPLIFELDCKHSFLRFARVSLKLVDGLSCFSFSLTMFQRLHAFLWTIDLLSWGTLLRPPSIFLGTYLCCSPSSPFL